MALGGGSLAGFARFSFEAVTGEFNVDVQKSEDVYRNATRGMSDDAIKLELSQDKLRRSLAKGPAAYREVARAELQVRQSERALRGETDHLTSSLNRNQRELGQSARGALLGTGAFRSLGRSVAFASAGFLGGAGLVYGMRSAINVASNLEEQINATQVVFKGSADTVLGWSKTTSTSIGIARDQALQYAGSIGGIANASGLTRDASADLSKSIVQLAADLASAKNEDPSEMLEALRSGLVGEAEPLRRRGVLLSAAAVQQEAFRLGLAKTADELTEGVKVQARYSIILKQTKDIQGDYARTADSLANSQRTLSALWREAQGLVGQALAPAFTDAVQGLRDWLSVEENQVELQRTVNQLVGDGEKVVRGFAAGLKLVKDAAEPVVGAVGGVGNAVEIATVAWVAFKLKALLGFSATALASRATATRMVADAAVAGRAWDVATRPRVMSVTTVAGGGRLGGLGRGALGLLGLTPGGAILTGAALVAYFGIRSGQREKISTSDYEKLKREAGKGRVNYDQLNVLARFLSDEQEREIFRLITRANVRSGKATDFTAIETARNAPIKRPGSPGDGARPRRTLADIELDIARPGNEVGDLLEKRSFIQREIDALERRKKLTDKQKADLAALYGQLASTQSQLDAIADAGEQKIADQRAKAATARREAREKRAAAIRERIERRESRLSLAEELAGDSKKDLTDDKKALIALRKFYGEQAANDKLTLEERQAFAAKRRDVRRKLQALYEKAISDAIEDEKITERERARLRQLGGADLVRQAERELGKKGDADKSLTQDDVRRQIHDLLAGLRGVVSGFGSNFAADSGAVGQMATHAYAQTELLREQNRTLDRLAGGTWHPGAGYTNAELSAAGLGVGF